MKDISIEVTHWGLENRQQAMTCWGGFFWVRQSHTTVISHSLKKVKSLNLSLNRNDINAHRIMLVVELKREAYESERYETNEVYLLNETYFFSNLDEVEEFVLSYGHTLENIKWPIEMGMP